MAKLIYSTIASLDGYVADADGNFDWAAPDDAVHSFVNDLEREVGTYLYGRRMYEVMHVWQTMREEPDQPQIAYEYAAIWEGADKVVYSTTLDEVSTPRTQLESSFDAAAVRRFVHEAERDVSVGGPTLAGTALRAGIVDEVHVFQNPIVVGGGKHYLPGGVRIELELLDERSFANGVVYLRYGVSSNSRYTRTNPSS